MPMKIQTFFARGSYALYAAIPDNTHWRGGGMNAGVET